MSASVPPRAYVRLTGPAVEDLARLVRRDPQIARQALKKMLLLERDPLCGEPLLGDLIGFRKLTVGHRHWRIVWHVVIDQTGRESVEIAEVWAAGGRSGGEVYDEMTARIEALPTSPKTEALAEVIDSIGRAAGAISASQQPRSTPVPVWLVDRLVHTAGLTRGQVDEMTPEAAMQTWEAFITGPPD